MGARDLENGTMEVARRDERTKETLPIVDVAARVEALMTEIQANLFERALRYRSGNIKYVDTLDDFQEALDLGGFVYAHWDGTAETEASIKEKTKATIRCIPMDGQGLDADGAGSCILTGKPSARRVLFARAY